MSLITKLDAILTRASGMIIKWTCENFIYWIVTTYTFQVLKKVKCHWDEFYESKFFRSLQKSLEKLDEKVGETRGDVGNCRVLLNISLFVGLKWIASSRQSGILVEVKRGVDKLGVGDSFQEILFFSLSLFYHSLWLVDKPLHLPFQRSLKRLAFFGYELGRVEINLLEHCEFHWIFRVSIERKDLDDWLMSFCFIMKELSSFDDHMESRSCPSSWLCSNTQAIRTSIYVSP